MSTGTESLLALAKEGRERAPNLLDFYDFRWCSEWMIKASLAIERLAHLDPDIDVETGEN